LSSGDQFASICQAVKIGQTVVDLWPFNGFSNGGRPPSRIFKTLFLTADGVQKVNVSHHGKWWYYLLRCADLSISK